MKNVTFNCWRLNSPHSNEYEEIILWRYKKFYRICIHFKFHSQIFPKSSGIAIISGWLLSIFGITRLHFMWQQMSHSWATSMTDRSNACSLTSIIMLAKIVNMLDFPEYIIIILFWQSAIGPGNIWYFYKSTTKFNLYTFLNCSICRNDLWFVCAMWSKNIEMTF